MNQDSEESEASEVQKSSQMIEVPYVYRFSVTRSTKPTEKQLLNVINLIPDAAEKSKTRFRNLFEDINLEFSLQIDSINA